MIINIGGNQLHGSIPAEVGACSSLRRLILRDNSLTGMLPEFAEKANLDHMDISKNSIARPIPSGLANCSNFTSIDISSNNLSGSLKVVGKISTTVQINVSDNHFTGAMPKTLMKYLKSSPFSFADNPGLCICCDASSGLRCQRSRYFTPCERKSGPGNGQSKVEIATPGRDFSFQAMHNRVSNKLNGY